MSTVPTCRHPLDEACELCKPAEPKEARFTCIKHAKDATCVHCRPKGAPKVARANPDSEYWQSAERNAAEVESWPAARRTGINTAQVREQPAAPDEIWVEVCPDGWVGTRAPQTGKRQRTQQRQRNLTEDVKHIVSMYGAKDVQRELAYVDHTCTLGEPQEAARETLGPTGREAAAAVEPEQSSPAASCDFSNLPKHKCSHCGGRWDASDTAGDSPELAAIKKRLADWPHTGWAVEDCRTLVSMVDDLTAACRTWKKVCDDCEEHNEELNIACKGLANAASATDSMRIAEKRRAETAEAELEQVKQTALENYERCWNEKEAAEARVKELLQRAECHE